MDITASYEKIFKRDILAVDITASYKKYLKDTHREDKAVDINLVPLWGLMHV